jgi:hypothetical protein
MDEPDPLALISVRTSELVARQLRSSSAVVARLRTRIEEAVRLGHPHRAIHAALEAGGLHTSWHGYQRSLARARKAARSVPPTSSQNAVGSDLAEVGQGRLCDAVANDAACTTPALDALTRAKRVASRDYARVARDHYRKDRP